MIQKPQTKGEWFRLILQIFLSIACALMLVFIFSNSLKSAEQSIEQSSHTVQIVQDFVAVFDPDSPIVTAQGEDYDLLHEIVRTIAHFAEFGLLGVLLGWCLLSYTTKKKYLLIPLGGVLIVPLIDECLQLFSVGRGMQFSDILLDIGGGILGLVFAVATVWFGLWLHRRRVQKKKKGEQNGQRES
ncbi:MAG: VanZ family protein [Clostridiales bacterium]|nr:VanZ family protein [Clostridiales bacterium]